MDETQQAEKEGLLSLQIRETQTIVQELDTVINSLETKLDGVMIEKLSPPSSSKSEEKNERTLPHFAETIRNSNKNLEQCIAQLREMIGRIEL